MNAQLNPAPKIKQRYLTEAVVFQAHC